MRFDSMIAPMVAPDTGPLEFLGKRSHTTLELLGRLSVAPPTVDFLRGALDLLILRALSLQPTHGYGVARWIEQASEDTLRIEEGSLYPALYRLEDRGWVESEWGLSENNRRAKFYRLTRVGRDQLRAEVDNFSRFAGAVFKVLATAPRPA
jgi:PadR family transcriptional regulator PadR